MAFCRIRSYLSTCRKHDMGAAEALEKESKDEQNEIDMNTHTDKYADIIDEKYYKNE